MHPKKIAFAGPDISEREVKYVAEAARSGFYDNYDAFVRKLEKRCCEYVGVSYGIATHCCTLALHLSCVALGLKEGDEVICTDFSWAATAHAIAYTGALPVFVDILPETWNIDPAAIERAVTSRTKAIMVVHTFGQPADMDAIMSVAARHGLHVIEDAAPALGAEFKGRKVGGIGHLGCFSFHGAKLAVSGEGGILLTNDRALYERAKLMASMGRTDSEAVFWCDELGFQYTMANITAALALAQVERVDELLEKKRRIFGWYTEFLSETASIELVQEPKYGKGNFCYPSLLLKDSVSVDRNRIVSQLKALNIHCRPAFPQLSRFPFYEARFPNPVAQNIARRGISLPSALNVEKEDIQFVAESLLGAIRG